MPDASVTDEAHSHSTETEVEREDGYPPIQFLTRSGTWPDEHWSTRHMLSLDGGGVRGYWSILVLLKLMEAIARAEFLLAQVENRVRCDSFWPEDFPTNAMQMNGRLVTYERLTDAEKFFPCHYFDLIVGSSTGALIAILLARFRTTAAICRSEYRNLSHKIFGRPRWISQRSVGVVPWPKYSAKRLEDVFKGVTHRRCEDSAWGDHRYTEPPFSTIRDTCAALVTTMRRTKNADGKGPWLEKFHLIRSYTATSKTGRPESMQIWEVARAATAAPMYFKEFCVYLRQEQSKATKKNPCYFTDGGFGVTNNPTEKGFEELKSLAGQNKDNIGVIVSIGTARGQEQAGKRSIIGRMRKFAYTATDPRPVAESMERQQLPEYWRFNDEERGLQVELDEWVPNKWFTKDPGHTTLEKIESAFAIWYSKFENHNRIEECAKALVAHRHRRLADRSRWQRYATGATKYQCKNPACRGSEKWDSLYQFVESHWKLIHLHEADGDKWKTPTFDTWAYQEPRDDNE